MVNDIGVVATDKALMALFERVKPETRVDFTLREGLLEEGVEAALALVEEGAKVLVSRGETTTMIRSAGITVPIVDVPISVHDVIPLIDQARHYSDNIAVVGFGAVVQAAEAVVPILSVKLDIFRLFSAREIPEVVKLVKSKGFTVMVGTPKAVEMAEGLGLRGFAIQSHAPVLVSVLGEADKLAEVVRRENQWRLRQQAFINSTQEDVFFLDSQGRVLQCAQHSLLNENIAEILFNPDKPGQPLRHKEILASVRKGEIWKGELLDSSGESYLCRVHPVAYEGQNFGAMLLLEKNREIASSSRREVFQNGLVARYNFKDVIHASPVMQRILDTAKDYATVDSNLLVVGESGTGKDMVAQSVHNASRRRHGPFVAINCAALPEQLLESELFGYQDGAFTGARREGRVGMFELANTGTIFLDEIGEMTPAMQAKLLRTVEERSIIRLGGDKVIPVDVRVICATNRNPGEMIEDKTFRQDLYFRINVLRITLPPLRERPECLPVLARRFLREISSRLGWPVPGLHPEAMAVFYSYSFPGNVREFKSLLERLVITCRHAVIGPEEVKRQMEEWAQPGDFLEQAPRAKAGEILRREEMKVIHQVLDDCNGNRTQAAKKLGISTSTLWRRLHQESAN